MKEETEIRDEINHFRRDHFLCLFCRYKTRYKTFLTHNERHIGNHVLVIIHILIFLENNRFDIYI